MSFFFLFLFLLLLFWIFLSLEFFCVYFVRKVVNFIFSPNQCACQCDSVSRVKGQSLQSSLSRFSAGQLEVHFNPAEPQITLHIKSSFLCTCLKSSYDGVMVLFTSSRRTCIPYILPNECWCLTLHAHPARSKLVGRRWGNESFFSAHISDRLLPISSSQSVVCGVRRGFQIKSVGPVGFAGWNLPIS